MKLFSWAPGPEATLESDPHEWAEYNLPADLHRGDAVPFGVREHLDRGRVTPANEDAG
jgi:hypothetical protein